MEAPEFLRNYFKDFDLNELEPDEIAEVMTAYHYAQSSRDIPIEAEIVKDATELLDLISRQVHYNQESGKNHLFYLDGVKSIIAQWLLSKLGKGEQEEKKEPELCPYCDKPVNYLNHKEHLYMNCI